MRMDRRGGALVVGLALLCISCVSPKEFTPLAPSVPQLRLPRNDVYEGSVITGSLRPTFVWEASTNNTDRPLHYELQYSSDPELADDPTPIVTSDPTFRPSEALPVSTVPPVGRRYYWRVRACLPQICSDYSPTWWVNLGRSSKDFNGDGYADVAVGSPDQTRGAVYVYFGGPSGLDTTHDGIIYDSVESEYFGGSVASAGDFNGDGFSDLLVGAYTSSAAGRAYLYFGGPGPSLNVQADVIFSGTPGSALGKSVSGAGDLNGDGFSDIVIGAPSHSGGGRESGRAYVYFGGTGGALDLPDGTLYGKMVLEQFGQTVSSAGDLNGDGFSELTVTSGLFDDNPRMPCIVQVFSGSSGDSFNETPSLILEGKTDTDCRSISLNGGDINQDGFADLLIGTAPSSPERHFASILLGGRNMDLQSEVTISPRLIENSYIGALASAGDVNGDGRSDILIGAQIFGSQPRTLVFLSADADYESRPPAAVLRSTLGSGTSFGYSLGAEGDINGDGFDDIVVGSYAEAVYVYFGNAGGTIDSTADSILVPSPRIGLYGVSVL